MNGQTVHPQVQTLGTCLSQIGAGDPCPWCGARLGMHLSAQAPRTVPAVGISGASGGSVLTCPDCGCEISAEEGADDVRGRRSLSVAA